MQTDKRFTGSKSSIVDKYSVKLYRNLQSHKPISVPIISSHVLPWGLLTVPGIFQMDLPHTRNKKFEMKVHYNGAIHSRNPHPLTRTCSPKEVVNLHWQVVPIGMVNIS